jgi:hypothetical protein
MCMEFQLTLVPCLRCGYVLEFLGTGRREKRHGLVTVGVIRSEDIADHSSLSGTSDAERTWSRAQASDLLPPVSTRCSRTRVPTKNSPRYATGAKYCTLFLCLFVSQSNRFRDPTTKLKSQGTRTTASLCVGCYWCP